ncbi:aminotransferase class IV [Clostridium intestinale]|uniref:Aminotransferase class IV n=1 Tax=Clostridium intestinale TaxID=36845 RepID=A0A7D6ZW15_9CLOT|nr:aminotransferase class IV [Clostridium intestinale]QLY81193.1 aminotransferase class IV [Clostridium intestinale]
MDWIKVYKGEAKIDVDEGIFFGKGVFETILILEKPVMLQEHLKRLNTSLKKLSIDKEINYNEVVDIIEKDNIKNRTLKITITPKNNIIYLRDIPYKKEDYDNGFSLGISELIKDSNAFLTSIKSTCYYENIHIRDEGLKKGFNEMLLINSKGKISEGTLSNIFFIKEEKIFTPSLSCGLLDGIMRQWVINNYDVQEGEFTTQDLLLADEIFITNSLVGVMWINRVKDNKLFMGKITNNIIERYKTFLKENGGA